MSFFWDFTIPEKDWKRSEIIDHLKQLAKKWVFQLEKGEKTGYLHYQGRMSLKEKTQNLVWEGAHISRTSTGGSKSFNYVMKEETRIDGPWSNKDTKKFLQKKVELVLQGELNSMQEWMKKEAMIYKDRIIDILIDKEGKKGKSTLVSLAAYEGWGRKIPMTSGMNTKDIMQLVMQMPKSRAYFIDFPKVTDKKKLQAYFEAIEIIKDGYAFDTRYEFEEEWFEVPRIFVFMNKKPDLSMLSADRWKLWMIDEDGDVVKYKEDEESEEGF